MTMKSMFLLALFLPVAFSWTGQQARCFATHQRIAPAPTSLFAAPDTNDPCWQNIYDEDCSMENAYAANFVASKWVKTMPCAEGIEDCDMPEDLQLPGNRQEAGDDDIDVMNFLNLKRAKSVSKEVDDDGANDGVTP